MQTEVKLRAMVGHVEVQDKEEDRDKGDFEDLKSSAVAGVKFGFGNVFVFEIL